MVGVARPPDEYRLANDVVFGHEAPVARVGRVVAVVALHPVVVHAEGVLVGLLAVDVYLSVLHLQVVALVDAYRTLVDGDVVHCERERSAAFRNPNGSVVVACPALVAVERIGAPYVGGVVGVGHGRNALHHILARTQRLNGGVGERQVAVHVERSDVLVGDAQLVDEFERQLRAQLHVIAVLHVVWLLVRFAVEVDDAVLYLQSLTGQTYAALHVVLAAVDGACLYSAELRRVLVDELAACGVELREEVVLLLLCGEIGYLAVVLLSPLLLAGSVGDGVEVAAPVLGRGENGVASRVVEHNDVVELHLAQSLSALVAPLRPLDIRVAVDNGQRVLRQRQRERGLRLARAVAHLRHEEVVAYEQRLLKRRRRDDVVLEEVDIDEVNGYKGEHKGVDPRHDGCRDAVL